MAKRPRPTLAALALALALGACTPPEERAEQARQAIGQAVEQGNRAAAIAAADELRESLPDTADSLLEVSQSLVRAGDAARAGWLLEEGVQRFPERDDLRLALARVALLLGDASRARTVVLPIEPDSEQHAAALVARAQAELGLGDLEQALATLGEAEEHYPDQPEARLVRIATLLSEHRPDEARAAIDAARANLSALSADKAGEDETAAEEARAIRRGLDASLAQIQAQQGDRGGALATLEGMVASDPADVAAWRALVEQLVGLERAPEALTRLEAALANDAAPPELHALVALVHAHQGDDAAAEAALRTFVAQSKSPAAVLALVDFFSSRAEPEAARAALEEAIARHPEEAPLRLLRAELLLDEEEVADARAEAARFEDATFESDPQIRYLEARLVLAEGDASGAADRLKTLAPDLDRAATQFWLGAALEQTGDIEGARVRYSMAQRNDPAWTRPAAALIALEQKRGDWRAVAAAARALVARSPEQIGAWSALVDALSQARDGEAAEAAARQCLGRFPDRAEAQVLLAKGLRAQGKTDEALKVLDAADALDSTPEAKLERVNTLGMGGRTEEAVALVRLALAAEPARAELHAAQASLLFAMGTAAEGAAATDRALELDPDEPRPLRVRCEFRAASGAWPGARHDCERYLEARPNDAGAHFLLGAALQQLGETDAAAAAYRRAAALDERDLRPRNNLADLLARQGDLDGALAAAQEAHRLDEANPYVMDTLGALYLEKGLAERAVSLLEDAHAGLPEYHEVTLHLALAYREVERTEKARALLGALDDAVEPGDPLRPQVDRALESLP